jgi:hypothetical protein
MTIQGKRGEATNGSGILFACVCAKPSNHVLFCGEKDAFTG